MSGFFYTENALRDKDLLRKDRVRRGQKPVVAIGNFDGFHNGHRVLLDNARTLAAASADVYSMVMTFEPHPRTVFKPDTPVFRLSPPIIKKRLVEAIGLESLMIVPFTREFANMSADAFVDELLINLADVAHVVVGYDFYFGKGRQGSPEFLEQAGKERGFGVSVIPAQYRDDQSIAYSSTQVRDCLMNGRVEDANAILGYRYFVSGEVIHGEKRGRELGFPTANMRLAEDNRLKFGIYAVQMRVDGTIHRGVASFGRRPSFDNGAPLLETYLFDFKGDLYGKTVEVVFEAYLRGEEKFDDLDALIDQMTRDKEKAQSILEETAPLSELDRNLDRLLGE